MLLLRGGDGILGDLLNRRSRASSLQSVIAKEIQYSARGSVEQGILKDVVGCFTSNCGDVGDYVPIGRRYNR